ncbi:MULTISPECIES: hypothetical protein [Burkholderia]|jgi:hypothetical protein|uniref:Uncharacterized protein n=1 Tax=Burkholderia contaminans TaxID=488447 RepID=A0AAP1VDV9_9BURK|nr:MULTISPECIES: hypothetical protein [Burkholderia]UTP21106.1 hypothetical protein NMB33_11185 [Burkholderia sp. FXe9]MBH9693360.1 hypothetical protein [Burkholderia contaminans]MBK1904862.1 hypothetical protein [Burkholderia contaminans]MBK1913051.1 hypothetical protein [Burkholderia contaminans]MBK1922296.1 hypothetical protein [Burkholderia contaminans]
MTFAEKAMCGRNYLDFMSTMQRALGAGGGAGESDVLVKDFRKDRRAASGPAIAIHRRSDAD